MKQKPNEIAKSGARMQEMSTKRWGRVWWQIFVEEISFGPGVEERTLNTDSESGDDVDDDDDDDGDDELVRIRL